MDFSIPAEHLFEHELRLAVGVDRSLRKRFVDWHAFGNSEGCAGRGEDEFFHPGVDGGIEEVDSRADVVAKIFRRILHRFSNEGSRGKMHDGVRFDLADGMANDGAVGEVALEKPGARIQCLFVAFAEVVKDGDFKALIQKLLDTNAADVAGSACHKNRFHRRRHYFSRPRRRNEMLQNGSDNGRRNSRPSG